MRSTLYRNGVVHCPSEPSAAAFLVVDGRLAWLGAEHAVHTVLDGADDVVDLEGALVTPGFVDAHAHVLETGFVLDGLDLSPRAGITSSTALLDAVAAAARDARASARAEPLTGHGWDESAWPGSRPPTRAELDHVTGGAPVYLSRADLHSAVVSSSFADVAGCRDLPGWTEEGLVTGEAHHRARLAAREVGPARREELHLRALREAAAHGIVSLHEHSAPYIDTRDGLRALLELTAEAVSGLPGVVGYRAELCQTVDDARALLADVPGLAGIGGDLGVDGSLGSRTAALRAPYSDLPSASAHRGDLRLGAEQVANHVAAVTRAGAQAAFHVIGDRALDEVLLGFRAAADVEGIDTVRAAGHRLEHVEMVDARSLATMVLFGVAASVQPAFDATWGGPDGMYARRLGPGRAAALNPLADLTGAGIPMAFGSDSPVTRLDPWATVRAALHHHEPGQRMSATAAIRAHTHGGWAAARMLRTGNGEIRLGAPASLAIWRAESLVAQTPDARVPAWDTGPRTAAPLLPRLDPGGPEPVCLRTLRDGVVLHDALG